MRDRVASYLRARGLTPRFALLIVLALLASVLFLAVTAWLATDVLAGRLDSLDERILTWAQSRRQEWLTLVMLGITTLGGYPVLTVVALGAVASALTARHRGAALLLVLVFCGGFVLNWTGKEYVQRERPVAFFEPRIQVESPSFPSGHSLMSAVVYLTCGFLVCARAASGAARAAAITAAITVTLLVGTSRVYLGVHHPSDVLGGWLTGAAWTMTCHAIFLFLSRRRSQGPSTLTARGR